MMSVELKDDIIYQFYTGCKWIHRVIVGILFFVYIANLLERSVRLLNHIVLPYKSIAPSLIVQFGVHQPL